MITTQSGSLKSYLRKSDTLFLHTNRNRRAHTYFRYTCANYIKPTCIGRQTDTCLTDTRAGHTCTHKHIHTLTHAYKTSSATFKFEKVFSVNVKLSATFPFSTRITQFCSQSVFNTYTSVRPTFPPLRRLPSTYQLSHHPGTRSSRRPAWLSHFSRSMPACIASSGFCQLIVCDVMRARTFSQSTTAICPWLVFRLETFKLFYWRSQNNEIAHGWQHQTLWSNFLQLLPEFLFGVMFIAYCNPLLFR